MTAAGGLAIWIETKLPGWNERGVDLVESFGAVLFHWMDTSGKLDGTFHVFVGTPSTVKMFPLKRPDFVEVIIDPSMSFEHSKVLIENAVEEVAGR